MLDPARRGGGEGEGLLLAQRQVEQGTTVAGIEKRYGDKPALHEVSFRVAPGEAVGVVGKSGAGKSTLIRCITGIEPVQSGRILLEGVDLSALHGAELRRARQRIGMVFQHFNLLQSRTALGNVLLPLELAGVRRQERRQRAAELLQRVGLAEHADKYPTELSGGQQQRVGIARALALRPALLLCDEPTSALDPATAASILALIDRVRRESGVAVLMVSHDMRAVRAVCDRVVVLDKGHVVEEGPTSMVLQHPHSLAARELLRGAGDFGA